MKFDICRTLGMLVSIAILSTATFANDSKHGVSQASPSGCAGFGPQSPRDIDLGMGTNPIIFSQAPSYKKMNLCNIHFHNNAEHKAKDFSIFSAVEGKASASGYQCNISRSLSKIELTKPDKNICEGLKPGDTIEVHWVHSSCNVTPGKSLNSCLADTCANPSLRVETQVFTLVNDPAALNFEDMAYRNNIVNGYHQAKSLPDGTGKPVEYIGSTTGTSYSNQSCSEYQVSWSVRPQCAKLDINSLGKWCGNNDFAEKHAHGVRELVTDPKLLSTIK